MLAKPTSFQLVSKSVSGDYWQVSYLSHSRALRRHRWSEPDQIYFVTTRCRDRQPILADQRFGYIVIQEIGRMDQGGYCFTHALMVMPDHIHWLLTLRERCSLSELMRRVKGRTSRRINRLRDRQGSLWQTGFHDHAVRREENLELIARYILDNPVRAGLVDHYSEYPTYYSSLSI